MHYLNTRKLVRIWFTKDPNTALPHLNQLRMIRLREKNPKATVLLVTNHDILSDLALQQLDHFCNKHALLNCDFDRFSDQLNSTLEQDLYQLAQQEILYSIENKGGNLAAASDIARLFFLKQGFLYSDFDTRIELNDLAELYPLDGQLAPLLLSVYYDKVRFKHALFPVCNDTIAFTTTDGPTIRSIITSLGHALLDRYKNPALFLPTMPDYSLFSDFLATHPRVTDIFSIRQLIADHYTMDTFISANHVSTTSQMMQLIKNTILTNQNPLLWSERFLADLTISDSELLNRWFLSKQMAFLKGSIMVLSGPDLWKAYLFKTIDRDNPNYTEEIIAEKLSHYSLATYGLFPYLYSPQGVCGSFVINEPELKAYFDRATQEPTNDASWDTTGVMRTYCTQEEPWVL